MRIMDEASLSEKNCFITLTYDEKNIPVGGSLEKRDLQLFFKRLRKEYGKGIRYFACGEYGETTARPHYHAAVFGVRFPDCILHTRNRNGDRLFVSNALARIWNKGHCLVGELTNKSAAYVARYVTKKVNGKGADDHYLNKETGEVLPKEFVLMSRGSKKIGTGGLGKRYYEMYKSDMYPSDFRYVDGRKQRLTRYYDERIKIDNPVMYDNIKQKRLEEVMKNPEKSSLRVLRIKEKILMKRTKDYLRSSV